jgi:hypothetical protein
VPHTETGVGRLADEIIKAGVLLAVASAALYFTGWLWLFEFMKYFSAHLFVLDVPKEYIFMHGATFALFAGGPLAALAWITVKRAHTRRAWQRRLLLFAGAAACGLFYFWGISASAEFMARSRVAGDFFPSVRLMLRDLEALPADETTALLALGEARLLVQGASKTFIIVETAGRRELLVVANDRIWLTAVTASVR